MRPLYFHTENIGYTITLKAIISNKWYFEVYTYDKWYKEVSVARSWGLRQFSTEIMWICYVTCQCSFIITRSFITDLYTIKSLKERLSRKEYQEKEKHLMIYWIKFASGLSGHVQIEGPDIEN